MAADGISEWVCMAQLFGGFDRLRRLVIEDWQLETGD